MKKNLFKRHLALAIIALLTCLLISSISFASPSLSVSETTLEPSRELTVYVSGFPTTHKPWIGLLPADADINKADSHDIAYKWLSDANADGGKCVFTMPYVEGRYIVGVFEEHNDDNILAISDVITTKNVTVSINGLNDSYEKDEPIYFSIDKEPAVALKAWVGLVPADVNDSFDSHDVAYIWVSDLENLSGQFIAPSTEGYYKLGVFLDNADDVAVGLSDAFYVGYNAPNEASSATITPDRYQLQPLEELTVRFDGFSDRDKPWIGLLPADADINKPDSYDIAYAWVSDLKNKTWTIKMPRAEGQYKIGIFRDGDNDSMIVASDVITTQHLPVSINLQKTTYAQAEKIPFTIDRAPVDGHGAWVGMVPADVQDSFDSHDIAYIWVSDLNNLAAEFTAPKKSGTFKLGVFLDNSDDMPLGFSAPFSVGSATVTNVPVVTAPTAPISTPNQTQKVDLTQRQSGRSRAKNDNPLVEKVKQAAQQNNDLPFSDLPTSHWSYPYVQIMHGAGIINGYPDNTFRPDDEFSRAAFAKMLSLSYGLEPYTGNQAIYSDVNKNDWHYPYVMAAEMIEAINYFQESDGTRTYRPNVASEREDVAIALVTLLGLDPADADLSLIANYKDLNKISRDMRPYVALAAEYGIMQGDNNGYFQPHAPLTRAQACKVFAVVLTTLGEW